MAQDEQDSWLGPELLEIKIEELETEPDTIRYEGSGSEEDKPTEEEGDTVLRLKPAAVWIKTEVDCEDIPLEVESTGSHCGLGDPIGTKPKLNKRRLKKDSVQNGRIICKEKKLFECDMCSFKSKQNYYLVQHYRLHTGEKPFSCDICDMKFTRRHNLVVHKRIHSGERPFNCNDCNYKSTCKGALTKHIRVHTGERPYSCDLCDRTFIRKDNLVVHKRTHIGEKPFSCKYCEYRSGCKGDLTKHIRIHTGEKPYSCDVCDLRFNRKDNLVAHKRTHTGGKGLPS